MPDLRPSGSKAVLICGPTASGKSALAMRIAEESGGTIVNADAMQVYSCWRILTARPTRTDETRLPHALYGHVEPTVGYSVGSWLNDVRRFLEQAPANPPIFVGGTGLYFFALTHGLAPVPDIPDGVRSESRRLRSKNGLDVMIRDLRNCAPEALEGINLSNPARVARAWEVQRATGRSLAHWHALETNPLYALDEVDPILLWPDAKRTAAKIDRRLRQMVKDGVIEECREVFRSHDPSLPYSKALGAREFRDHLEGTIGLDETLTRIAAATRQFAKRQRTWFRSRMSNWRRLSA